VQRRTAVLWLALAMVGCSSEMAVQTVTRPNLPPLTPRAPACALTVYAMDHVLDASCVEVGDVYVGDTGFSTDCGLERVRDTIRAEACRYGADAAQIVSHHAPTFFGSTCHQVRARFLVCKPEEPDAV
jgi:hypothetical protein